jgi:hypothetical protein
MVATTVDDEGSSRRLDERCARVGFRCRALTANGQTVRYRVAHEIASAQTGCVPTAINDNGDAIGCCGGGETGSSAVV